MEGRSGRDHVNRKPAAISGRYLGKIETEQAANGNDHRVATVARVREVMGEKRVFVYTTKIAAKAIKRL